MYAISSVLVGKVVPSQRKCPWLNSARISSSWFCYWNVVTQAVSTVSSSSDIQMSPEALIKVTCGDLNRLVARIIRSLAPRVILRHVLDIDTGPAATSPLIRFSYKSHAFAL